MSGHSKWHNIQERKGKVDSQKAKLFTKVAKEITVSVKEGGGADAEANPRLRSAIAKAKTLSMPKDNIERAIARGVGGAGEGELEDVVYEAFGPGGSAFIVTALTDNRNRTAAVVRELFKKVGGSVGSSGSVMWMFNHAGVIQVATEKIVNRDEFELALIEAGASEINENENLVEIICPKQSYGSVLEVCSKFKIEPESSGLEYVAKEDVSVSGETESQIKTLIDSLDNDDDVQDFFTNAI
jgi:YebC/PmpR family DNA-binding regulatory protein